MDVQFGITSYKHDTLQLSAQRCINAYAETQPRSAKAKIAMFGVPGMSRFATLGVGPIRGALEMNGVAYFVSSDDLYSIDADGHKHHLGNGITGSGNVSMAGNGFEIVIVNGIYGFSYLLSDGTFVQISDADFLPCNTVTVVNEIFVFDKKGTNEFFISNVLDGRTYDALDFASAESSPDFVVAVRNRNGILMLFGATTIEPWDNTGAIAFPFSRIKGSTIERGIAGPLAIESEDAALFFLGNDRVFYRLAGLQLQRISTFAIEHEWTTYGTTADAFCFKAAIDGHKFIYITFPTENATWAYDIATQLWHERLSWSAAGQEIKWRASCAIDCYNRILVGDADSGKIGVIDKTLITEFGDPIVMSLTSPPLYGDGKRIYVPSLEVDVKPGVGLTRGQGVDPQIMMDYSIDGGINFTAPQTWSTLGRIGAYDTRVNWNHLGSGYQFCFRVSISDPVLRTIMSARCPDAYFEP